MNVDSPQLAEHFAQAAELDGEEQSHYLDRLGEESPSLRREAEKLLRA